LLSGFSSNSACLVKMSTSRLVIFVATLALVATLCLAAVHHHKEREEDGAISPKDKGHSNAGGEHDPHFDHQAILGSHKEADEFDDLAPEEAKKRLRILAGKMDRNSDGVVDKTELHQWIVRSFRMLSREDSDERLKEEDQNEDGFIEWSEHKAAEFDDIDEDNAEGKMDSETLDDLQMLFEDKVLFTAADFNGDSKLNGDEYFAFSHPEDNLDRMRDALLKNTKRQKDENNDGKIDFQEFVGQRGKDHDKEWLQDEKERFDNDLDTNKDGFLDDNEIIHWIVPSDENVAEDEVTHLFASADDDHDGKLTIDEIVKHHEVFVGSEATDYGDHLHRPKIVDEL